MTSNDPKFWHERWEKNDTGFHEGKPNQHLVKYFNDLALPKGARIFIPLCGKTIDISWLLSSGFRVAGAELSKIAIDQLFNQLGLQPTISKTGRMERYSAKDIDIFVGNIFDLSREILGPIDAIYDRAALVALPPDVRRRYAAHLKEISNHAPQLLISFEYDQTLLEGPPFSVTQNEVRELYGDAYQINLKTSEALPDGLKGKYPAIETAWLLSK